ncbi:MAG: glycosyl transferase family 1, partial [Winogradskyella sp.]|nr:glycosyl transferase family 1 [Winogradskyella sp.]
MNSKKVLIITYYWPPAGGPGVQRWLKFVKYLPDFGIEPIVYCPENPNYPIIDESLVSELPEKITILKQPIS